LIKTLFKHFLQEFLSVKFLQEKELKRELGVLGVVRRVFSLIVVNQLFKSVRAKIRIV